MTTKPLNFLSFGAGAIGTYIGGSLALAGNRVVFLEQPSAAGLLRERGLHLTLDGREQSIPAPVVAESIADALALGPFDAALFALKSNDTAAALAVMTPHSDRLPPVLCLQNGVENETALAAALGPGKVIAGTVTSSVGRRAAGDIVLERKRGLGVAGGHPISAQLVDTFNSAGLNARIYDRPGSMKWSKMLTNLLANATSAILDLSPAEVFADSRLFALEARQVREALQVMRRLHLPVVDLPGVPVRLLAFALQWLPLAIARPLIRRAAGAGRGAKMPSFHIDLHSGKGKTEVDYLNGAVVRFGEKTGVETPVNRLLTDTLLALAQGDQTLDSFRKNPGRLLALVR